ncbi:MAG TPA: M56 family metallopeptidase, partial [Thermoanaerobaculia bacterium]|nr:M56 family metallopeptidase [Thermoanaerobaculia bacterium]
MILLAVKGTVAILLALAICAFARRARASLRHAVYAALFAVLLLLPVAPRVMPAVKVTAPDVVPSIVREPVAAAPAAPRSVDFARDDRLWLPSLRELYFASVLLLLASLATGVVRLRRLASRGEVWLDGTRLATEVGCAHGIRRAVLVVIAESVAVPMTFGFRRQTILLPPAAREWDDDALRRALRHELEHVRRDDWVLQLFARVACALWWPHPLVWIAWRRFCVEAERSCDDAVVRAFAPATYAEQLVTLARSIVHRRRVPALAMASPTRLTERVRAILDPAQRRGPYGRVASITMVVVMAAFVGIFGSVQLVDAAIQNNDAIEDGVVGGIEGALEARGIYADEMIRAAELGSIRRMREMLELGVDVNKSYDGDDSALLISARHGHLEACEFLLDHGADPNLPTLGDGNPLIAASCKGQYDVVKLLLERGARV